MRLLAAVQKQSDGRGAAPGGPIEITQDKSGKPHVEGGITVPTGRGFPNGRFAANVRPKDDTLAFLDDGSNDGEGCRVQMQRIDAWLSVGDKAAAAA